MTDPNHISTKDSVMQIVTELTFVFCLCKVINDIKAKLKQNYHEWKWKRIK